MVTVISYNSALKDGVSDPRFTTNFTIAMGGNLPRLTFWFFICESEDSNYFLFFTNWICCVCFSLPPSFKAEVLPNTPTGDIHFFFTLDLPAGEWVEYRLGVDNGQGVTVMLYDQPGYDGFTNLPITHWGSDDRSVEVTITYSHDSNTISVTGWSDFSGIQN